MNYGIVVLSLGPTIALYCKDFLAVEAQTEAQQASIKLKPMWAKKQ